MQTHELTAADNAKLHFLVAKLSCALERDQVVLGSVVRALRNPRGNGDAFKQIVKQIIRDEMLSGIEPYSERPHA